MTLVYYCVSRWEQAESQKEEQERWNWKEAEVMILSHMKSSSVYSHCFHWIVCSD